MWQTKKMLNIVSLFCKNNNSRLSSYALQVCLQLKLTKWPVQIVQLSCCSILVQLNIYYQIYDFINVFIEVQMVHHHHFQSYPLILYLVYANSIYGAAGYILFQHSIFILCSLLDAFIVISYHARDCVLLITVWITFSPFA